MDKISHRVLSALALAVVALTPLGAGASVEDLADARGALPGYANDPNGLEAPRRVTVNGNDFFLAAGATTQPPASVKRWYSAYFDRARFLGKLSVGDESAGGIGAFDLGGARGADDRAHRVAAFLGSGKLSDLGSLRFVLYQPDGRGGTRYVTVAGDAFVAEPTLRDALDAPPPPGARRIFAFAEPGQPYRLQAYRGESAIAAARSYYEGMLPANGWHVDDAFGRYAAARGHLAMHARKDGRELFVDLGRFGETATIHVLEITATGAE